MKKEGGEGGGGCRGENVVSGSPGEEWHQINKTKNSRDVRDENLCYRAGDGTRINHLVVWNLVSVRIPSEWFNPNRSDFRSSGEYHWSLSLQVARNQIQGFRI